MLVDEPTIQRIGAGIYEGAIKQKKKKEGGLLGLFIKFFKDLERDFKKL